MMSARFTSQLLKQQQHASVRGMATQAVRPPIALHGLAGKYASSAFVAAASKDAKSLDKLEQDLKQIKQLISGSSSDSQKVRDFIANPTLPTKEKAKAIDQLLGGKEGEITRNLFMALSEHGRLPETHKVIDGFFELMAAHRGEVEVVVTSAKQLDKQTFSRLEQAIKGSQFASKGKVKITQVVNPSIQGGLIVDFGDRSVDLSVQSRVNRLNNLLEQGV